MQELALVLKGSTPQVTTQVERLLEAAKYAGTREQLQLAAGMQHREHFRKAYLKPLIAARLLELTIPDQPMSRLQKYRLTETGRAWLELS